MISLEALSLFFAINESDLLEEVILTLLASPQLALFFEKFPSLKKALQNELPGWKDSIHQQLKRQRVPDALAREFMCFREMQNVPLTTFCQQLPTLLEKLAQNRSPFSENAYSLVRAAGSSDFSAPQQTLFLQRWRISLTLQILMLNQQLLDRECEKLLTELLQRLTISSQLVTLLTEDNVVAAGKLWDLSHAFLRQDDYQKIIDYGNFLASQPALQELATRLGRSHSAKAPPLQEAPLININQQIRYPDCVPEEITGLHQSSDILRLLPSELAMLGISELEAEFYRRLVEKKLLTYQLQGECYHEKKVQQPAIHQQHADEPRGPFIVCVDTSGSMGGFNERCAKSFCLALLRIALAENRRCVIMLFSHEVICYELTADDGISQAGRFLSQRFRGGTDLAACIEKVLKQLSEPGWHDADAVILSDFINQRLPEALAARVKAHQHQRQQRFHAVALSDYGKPAILHIFDYVWRFDTGIKNRLLRRWQH